jgi:hypothetical protein
VKITIKDAKAQLREVGVSVKKNQYNEFEVRIKGAPESHIYYTDDLQDAVDTGFAIAREAL